MKLAGFQLAMERVPPGLRTRAISEATSSGRGANMAPNMVTTRSKEASGVGQGFCVAFVELDGEVFGGGAVAGLDEEVGRDIKASDRATRDG